MGNKHVKSTAGENTAPPNPQEQQVSSAPEVVNGVEPAPRLTEQQVALLLDTWKELESNIAKVGVITFIRLGHYKVEKDNPQFSLSFVLFVYC